MGEVLLGPFDHGDQLVGVAGFVGDLCAQDDLVLLVDDCLGVVGVVESVVRLHHPGLGVGEVSLGGGLGLRPLRRSAPARSTSTSGFVAASGRSRAAASALSLASRSIASLAWRSFWRPLACRATSSGSSSPRRTSAKVASSASCGVGFGEHGVDLDLDLKLVHLRQDGVVAHGLWRLALAVSLVPSRATRPSFASLALAHSPRTWRNRGRSASIWRRRMRLIAP